MRKYIKGFLRFFGIYRRRRSKSSRNKSKIQVDNKLRVVLDMDECILCCEDSIGKDLFHTKPGLDTITIQTNEEKSRSMRIHIRPGLHHFLSELSEFADIYLMTAAKAAYALPAIKSIDPKLKFFTDIITREHFDFTNGKDLNALGDRFDICHTVLVDNLDSNFSYQPANGLLVREFFDDPFDRHLEDVLTVLRALRDVPDVREVLRPVKINKRYYHLFADELVYNSQLPSSGAVATLEFEV